MGGGGIQRSDLTYSVQSKRVSSVGGIPPGNYSNLVATLMENWYLYIQINQSAKRFFTDQRRFAPSCAFSHHGRTFVLHMFLPHHVGVDSWWTHDGFSIAGFCDWTTSFAVLFVYRCIMGRTCRIAPSFLSNYDSGLSFARSVVSEHKTVKIIVLMKFWLESQISWHCTTKYGMIYKTLALAPGFCDMILSSIYVQHSCFLQVHRYQWLIVILILLIAILIFTWSLFFCHLNH